MSDGPVADVPVIGYTSPSLDALEEGTETTSDLPYTYAPPRPEELSPCRDPSQYPPSPFQQRAHGERADALWRVAHALREGDDERWWRRVDRLLDCCRYPSAIVTPDGRAGLSLGRCRDRLCPTCSLIRSREVAARISAAVANLDAPRFMTLTIRSSGEPLETLLRRLREAFRRLRETALWKQRVKGGVYAIETTYNPESGGWHPHVHLIYDGSYIHQAVLSAAWLAATGDSPIVDIRAVRSKAAVARYVAKYVAKGVAAASWPSEAIAEYAAAMHGQRLMHTFGKLHGTKLTQDDEERLDHDQRISVSLSWLLRRWRDGCTRAQRIIWRLHSLGGLWARLLPRRTDVGLMVPAACRADRATRVGRLLWLYADRTDGEEYAAPPARKPDRVARHDQLTLADDDWAALRPRHGPYLSG